MRHLLLTAVFVSGLGMTATAQQGMQKRTPQERTDMQMRWMNKNLTLTQDQTGKLQGIIYKYAAKRDSIANGKHDPSKRDAMQQLMQQRDGEIKEVLNASQFAQFQTHEQEMRKRRMDQRQGPPTGGDNR